MSRLRERRWLVLDEVNRADIDKCFGELFTVLSGGTATTPYTLADGTAVTIGPDAGTYQFGPGFRLLATMNVRDKASLFRLSFAFLRRFAVIQVPGLADAELQQLAEEVGGKLGLGEAVWRVAVETLSGAKGLGRYFPLGPSMLIDVLHYALERKGSPHRAVAEGIELFVLPQLDGLADGQAKDVDALLLATFGADPVVADEVRAAFRSSYPHVRFHG